MFSSAAPRSWTSPPRAFQALRRFGGPRSSPPLGGPAHVELSRCLSQLGIVGDLSADAILVYDEDESIVFANQAGADLLGGTGTDDIVGRRMGEFVPEDEMATVEARRRALRAGISPEPGEFGVQGLSGSRRTMHVSSAPVLFRGMPARVVVARDVTAFKESERSRDHLEEQLAVARRLESLGRLAGGVAHDFNNLLTVITGYTGLALADVRPGSPLEESLLSIEEAVGRANGLTRQLLAFGRRQVLRPQPLDLNAVVADMEPMLSRLIGEDMALVVRLADERCPVEADRTQVEQVLVNLVMNARDAMPDGGEIVIATDVQRVGPGHGQGCAEAPSCYTVLLVSDQGPGMDQDTVDRIFEPFFTTKGQARGTGLGLSTVYGIVKQSGGAIDVDSRPGEGTTFRIWLPKADAGAEELARPADESETSKPDTEGTILLVEDDEAIRRLAERVLKDAGFTVLVAGDAEAASGLFKGSHSGIDLLITDVILPGMDGGTLAEEVGRASPDTRVLFISGYTAERIGSKGVVGDGVELLEKPFTPRALVRRARDILDRK